MMTSIKALLWFLIVSFSFVGGFFVYKKMICNCANKLSRPTDKTKVVKEMVLKYSDRISDPFNNLTPQERVFAYYIFRASLPGKRIIVDQLNRNGLEVIAIFKFIVDSKDELLKQQKGDLSDLNVGEFLSQAKTYLIYLWMNHGQYFQREHGATKRVPANLGLTLLTENNLTKVFGALQQPKMSQLTKKLAATIFDPAFEAVSTCSGSIKKSSVNIYSRDFTDEDFAKLSKELQRKLNAYFYVETTPEGRQIKSLPYSTFGKYSEELQVSVFWLKRAFEQAKKYQSQFDEHLTNSLDLLIKFLESGDEKLFKQHSIEWLKSNSKIDYCFGFIETYDDPKLARGMFEAEVTIKIFDSTQLDKVLKSISADLSSLPEFGGKQIGETKDSLKNLTVSAQLFGFGQLGPLRITAAYCLPNYDDIRAKYGSKQVVYPPEKSAARMLNPKLYRKLFSLPEQHAWLERYDPTDDLSDEINLLQTVLHEVVGHGCGKEKIKNSAALLGEYEHTIEELKAEIIALHTSAKYLGELVKVGFFKKWAQVSEIELQKQLVLRMAGTYFNRLLQQCENVMEIVGDHARANTIIARYLVDKGVLKFGQNLVGHDGKQFKIIGLEIIDLPRALKEVESLMKMVVTIRLSGDKKKAEALVNQYGIELNEEHLEILKNNYKAVAGDVKVIGFLHPKFMPILNGSSGQPEDIKAEWPSDVFDLYAFEQTIEMCTVNGVVPER